MPATFIDIDSIEKLDELFARSHQVPVVIFKHSDTCGISSMASRKITAVETEINLIIVQKSRDVSTVLAERTGVRHESPQAFVLKNGKAVYHASHYSIDLDEITSVLSGK
jgi:bacillithiol system protein YtxJ